MATCIVISYSALLAGMTASILLIFLPGGKQMANSPPKIADKRNAFMLKKAIRIERERGRESPLSSNICELCNTPGICSESHRPVR